MYTFYQSVDWVDEVYVVSTRFLRWPWCTGARRSHLCSGKQHLHKQTQEMLHTKFSPCHHHVTTGTNIWTRHTHTHSWKTQLMWQECNSATWAWAFCFHLTDVDLRTDFHSLWRLSAHDCFCSVSVHTLFFKLMLEHSWTETPHCGLVCKLQNTRCLFYTELSTLQNQSEQNM